MSYRDGWAAMNLDAPPRVPRTEYSAEGHWELIRAVTGLGVNVDTPTQQQWEASRAFMRAWNYDLVWSVLIAGGVFGNLRTDMGHAVYAAGGVDYNDRIACPFKSPEDVLAFDPAGALDTPDPAQITRDFEAHYRSQCAAYPECVNMTGVYVTMMSGLIDLFGWEMLLTAGGLDPEGFGAVADRYASWIARYFDALARADVPVVMVHDDIVWTSGPFFRPEWYRRFIFPNYRKLFAPLIESGKRILYTSDGTYTAFIDDIAACGVHGFVMEPTTDMAYVAREYGRTHVFIGNADTRVLLFGDREQIRAEVQRCMDIGKDCPGFFMAVGNHIPPNTPVENALYYNEVYEELSRR